MWPPPAPKEVPVAAAPPPKVAKEPPPPPNYFADTMKDSLVYTAGFGTVIGLNFIVPILSYCILDHQNQIYILVDCIHTNVTRFGFC